MNKLKPGLEAFYTNWSRNRYFTSHRTCMRDSTHDMC